MADLEALIRYRTHRVDEKKRALAELYRQAEQLEREKARLEDDILREEKLAMESGDAAVRASLSNYVGLTRAKISMIENGLARLATRIELARDEMREAFADLKKIEITRDRRAAEEKDRQRRKEEQMFDDIALDGYRRRQQDSE